MAEGNLVFPRLIFTIAPELKDDLKNLHYKLEMIYSLTSDPERFLRVHAMSKLKKLKDVAYDIEDIFDDFSYEFMRRQTETDNPLLLKVKDFFSSSNRLFFRTKMAYRIKVVTEKYNKSIELCRTQTFSNTSGNTTEMPADPVYDSNKIIGREKDISKLVDLLITPSDDSAENLSVVPIVGMAGVGKTKLARSVYNDESVTAYFELRIWVSLSANSDPREILSKIIEYIDNNAKLDYGISPDPMASLVQKMLRGKKYLLVIDDLWPSGGFMDSYNWLNLKSVLMCGSHGSKILVTSRKFSMIWNVRGISSAYNLQELSTDECWSIIKERSFSSIGKEIARQCCGLPLAAKVMRNTLCYETEEMMVLSNGGEITDSAEFHKNIYPIIKSSYDRLPSSALKQCFSYCSVFPNGRVIDRQEIIQLWMAEGFLVPSDRQTGREVVSMEDIGNEYFNKLLSDSLFQSAENKDDVGKVQKCKLNGLVHYVARSVAGNDGCSTLRAKEVVSFSDIRRLHLVFDEDMPRLFPEVGVYKDRIRSLFVLEVGDCDKIQDIFHNKNLRVLYLSGSTIQKVPASLSKLRHLRYLNLSGSQNLDVLDDQSTNSLYHLQTLVLHKCTSLSELPEGIGSMRSLRHLDISYTAIKLLPISVTSLQNLRTLDVSNCTTFECLPENVGALKDLRSLNLSHTGIKILPTSATSLQNLRTLDVSNCTNFEGLPENLGALKELRSLDISHTKVSRLPDSILGLERLMTLRLHSCPNLEDLPKGIEALRWLKGLDITGTKVKVVPEFPRLF